MANIYDSRVLASELEAILKANSDLDYVSSGAVVPLASETNVTAAYIAVESIAISPTIASTGVNAYDRHMFVSIYCNINTSKASLHILDLSDSIERSILTDNTLWDSLLDRDVVAINFDNQEHSPMRAFTVLLDIRYRLRCE